MATKDASTHSVRDVSQRSTMGKADDRAMARIGRTQELRRQFGPFAMLGFAVTLGVSFQSTLIGTLFSLPNGGPAGAVIMFIITAVGLTFVCFSLAEMSSIAPTAGGQYHWVSELAPDPVQKFMSYIVGWTANFAWQIYAVASTNASVQVLEGCIAIYVPGYELTEWQEGLCVILLLILQASINLFLLPLLPSIEFFNLFLNFAAFIAFEIVMLIMGPRVSAHDVFQNFNNENGWSSMSIAVLAGILGSTGALTNADSTVHMGEELKNSAVWLPRVVIAGGVFNYIIGFITLLTFLFRAADISAALTANPGMPFIAVLQNITGSNTAALILGLYVVLSSILSSTNMITTTSRQLYAFARDGGVPFGQTLRQVNRAGVPMNSILASLGFGTILACILMGSAIAFNIIAALGVIFLFASYMLSIGTVLYRRCVGSLPKSPFTLGPFGIPVNIMAWAFSALAFVLLFFPPGPDPSLAEMNWSCVVFVGFELFAIVLYVARQRHFYVPPVVLIREMSDQDIELERADGKQHLA